jgi:hypothetical protein
MRDGSHTGRPYEQYFARGMVPGIHSRLTRAHATRDADVTRVRRVFSSGRR